ncbi:MAG: FKBP-type peptidyl-prolyl cis-trans isomerase [Deltaproteobacteria bacterium]|nr:FKBP-type peptidyl-prolyl cis-trans isomerase [Deltaproteobacteria bacterium]
MSSLEGQFYFNPSGSAQNNQPAASTGQKEALERERQELAREKQEIERQKTLDAEREQLATERRKIEAERQQLAMGKRPFSSTTEETTRLEATKSLAEKNKQEGDLFHAENKKKEGVLTLRSGLQLKVIKEGTGNKPKVTDTITVNYRGTLIDGKEFDSSYRRGEPATFSVNGVISGWKEALLLMKVGAKWQLFIPSNLAYGEKGVGNIIGPNATLLFEVELISIK